MVELKGEGGGYFIFVSLLWGGGIEGVRIGRRKWFGRFLWESFETSHVSNFDLVFGPLGVGLVLDQAF